MAQLSGGSTVAGNEIIHTGNILDNIKLIDGSGSGLDADTLDGIDSTGFFRTGIEILANADLNDYMTEGNYFCRLNATAQTILNMPPTKEAFMLTINKYYTSHADKIGVMQTWKHYKSNTIYFRVYNTDADTWTSWAQIALKSDIPSIPTKVSQLTNDGDGTSVFVTADQLGSAGYGDMTKAQYDTDSDGIVDKAEKLSTARTITLSTDVTGSGNFDGSSNITIPVTIVDNSHNHTSANISDATNANTASMIVKRDASGNFSAGTITATLSGNATTATRLAATRTITVTGNVTGSTTYDGSANSTLNLTLVDTGISAGTYKSVTVDTKGRITAGTNPTTLAGYGITDGALKTDVQSSVQNVSTQPTNQMIGGIWFAPI